MLKKLLFGAIALAMFVSVSAQGTHQRRVMVEEFTNASCPPCAVNNPPFNVTLVANADKVTPLKYQVWWPGFDPMYEHNKADVGVRVAYYAVSGVPNGIENGVNFGVPGGSLLNKLMKRTTRSLQSRSLSRTKLLPTFRA